MRRAELIFLQIDIVGHSKLDVPDDVLHSARLLLERYVSALASVSPFRLQDAQGRTVFWAGDGGWVAFEARSAGAFEDATNAALDVQAMLPRFNDRIRAEVGQPVRLRVSVDVMNVELGGTTAPDLAHLASPQLNAFLKNEREMGLPDHVVIADRVRRQLPAGVKQRFQSWRTVTLDRLGATELFSFTPQVPAAVPGSSAATGGELAALEQLVQYAALAGVALKALQEHTERETASTKAFLQGALRLAPPATSAADRAQQEAMRSQVDEQCAAKDKALIETVKSSETRYQETKRALKDALKKLPANVREKYEKHLGQIDGARDLLR